jgi:serine protease Do
MSVDKKGKAGLYLLLLAVGLILGAVVGGEIIRRLYTRQNVWPWDTAQSSDEYTGTSAGQPVAATDAIGNSRRNAIVIATEHVEPCVVGIVVTQIQIVGTSYNYEDFFDLFFVPKLVPRYQEVQNMGSGFVISDEGLILTNNHVVEGAKKLYINFPDGRQLEGQVVGRDPYSDLAVVSVRENGFKSITFGNSDDLMIGEWVIAIGNPFLNFFNDAQPTVTVGVVSALNRNFAPSENAYYQNMIQTDAAINPGNSGGPLVNALGEVIGINAFIYTGSMKNKGSIGIGFAIPINNAKRVVKELVTHGRRRAVWTGISVQDLDRSIALTLGLEETTGVVITDLEAGSPGDLCGLRRSDVIVRMGNRQIISHNDLDGFFVNYFPGDTVTVSVMRNGKQTTKTIVLEEYPGS